MNSLELARTIVDVLTDKKGEDIILMDISEVADFADYFVICSGTSRRMVQALAKSVKDEIKTLHKVNTKMEGVSEGGWLLGDYGDVVVHIFSAEQRAYYQLEELWAEGKVLLHLQ